MGRENGYAEPVGAKAVPPDGAEVVLGTSQGEATVSLTWDAWELLVLLLLAVRMELRGVVTKAMLDGQVVAFEGQYRPILSMPKGGAK